MSNTVSLILPSTQEYSVLCRGNDVDTLPPHILMRCWAQHLRPDSTVWPYHTYCIWPLSGASNIFLYCTEYNGLRHWQASARYALTHSCGHQHMRQGCAWSHGRWGTWKIARRRWAGLKIGRRVQIVVHDSFGGAFAKDGAPNKAQRRRAFGGCGQWRLIPDTADDRMTPVEGIGQGQKRGWSVVCEYMCASQRAHAVTGRPVSNFFLGGAEISFFPQPLHKLLKLASSCFKWAQSHPWNCLCNLKILSRYYNSNFWNKSFYITRNDFLVSSKPPRRNPYLKAVDYMIHGKLRDSRKTTWFTEDYVILVKLGDTGPL